MSLSKSYKADKTAEVNGIEIVVELSTFIISRASRSNPAYLRALERITKPFRRQIETKTLSPEKSEDLFRQVFIDGVLKGWRDVPLCDVTGNDEDKGNAEFSKENAEKLFIRLPDLYDALNSEANDFSNFRDGTLEEAAKN